MVQECSFSLNPLVGFRDCVDVAPEPDWWTWLNIAAFVVTLVGSGRQSAPVGIAAFVVTFLFIIPWQLHLGLHET